MNGWTVALLTAAAVALIAAATTLALLPSRASEHAQPARADDLASRSHARAPKTINGWAPGDTEPMSPSRPDHRIPTAA